MSIHYGFSNKGTVSGSGGGMIVGSKGPKGDCGPAGPKGDHREVGPVGSRGPAGSIWWTRRR